MDKKFEEYMAGLIYLKCMGNHEDAFSLAWDIDTDARNVENTSLANKIYGCGYAEHSEGWADTHVHNMHIETPTLREDAKNFLSQFSEGVQVGWFEDEQTAKECADYINKSLRFVGSCSAFHEWAHDHTERKSGMVNGYRILVKFWDVTENYAEYYANKYIKKFMKSR